MYSSSRDLSPRGPILKCCTTTPDAEARVPPEKGDLPVEGDAEKCIVS